MGLDDYSLFTPGKSIIFLGTSVFLREMWCLSAQEVCPFVRLCVIRYLIIIVFSIFSILVFPLGKRGNCVPFLHPQAAGCRYYAATIIIVCLPYDLPLPSVIPGFSPWSSCTVSSLSGLAFPVYLPVSFHTSSVYSDFLIR